MTTADAGSTKQTLSMTLQLLDQLEEELVDAKLHFDMRVVQGGFIGKLKASRRALQAEVALDGNTQLRSEAEEMMRQLEFGSVVSAVHAHGVFERASRHLDYCQRLFSKL